MTTPIDELTERIWSEAVHGSMTKRDLKQLLTEAVQHAPAPTTLTTSLPKEKPDHTGE